jgi:NAD(P)-dependent dehydrogenase (short-subunit alcohol dehydrogenase family)
VLAGGLRPDAGRGGGRIVLVSSLSGVYTTEKFPDLIAYNASKHGVVGLMEGLAVEGRPHGIWAISVSPGAVDTEMLHVANPDLHASLTPDDVARLISDLLVGAEARELARSVGECRDTRTAADLVSFMETVAAEYPTGPVHVIWDCLNIHFDGTEQRWTAFNARHDHRFVFHYTPKHASWVNQIELFFSILQRQCVRSGSFRSPWSSGRR